MSGQLQKTVGIPYIANTLASPGRPYIPGHWASVTVWTVSVVNPNPGYTVIGPDQYGVTRYFPVANGAKGLVYTQSQQQVWVPEQLAIAPVAATTTTDYNLGWNAGAVASVVEVGDFTATFSVPTGISGAALGLNPGAVTHGLGDFTHGLVFSGGTVSTIESGGQVSYGSYAASNVFTIQRWGTQVKYLRGSTVLATSSAPSLGTVALEGSLYAGGDSITMTTLTAGAPAGDGYAVLTAMPAGLVGGNATYASADLYALPSTLVGADTGTGYGTLVAAFSAVSGDDTATYADGTLVAAPATLYAEGYAATAYALGSLVATYSLVAGVSETGGIGSGDLYATPSDLRGGNAGYATGDLCAAPATMYGDDLPPVMASVLGIYAADVSPPSRHSSAPMFSTLDISASMTTKRYVASAMLSVLQIGGTMTGRHHAVASMYSTLALASLDFTIPGTTCWVVNTNTGASWRYEDYPFNSFAKIGGRYYGAAKDGIYLLEGDSDNGQPIRAAADIGKLDLGSSAFKRVPNIYLGVASEGKILARVQENGNLWTYEARASREDQATQRVDLGRGIRANLINFEILNSDGCNFDLSKVELVPVELSRRI